MRVRAAVAWEAGAPLSIEEVDLDEPREDEILVRVEAVGVCRTDDKARHGKLPVVFPVILGHEGSGTVERAGAAVLSLLEQRQLPRNLVLNDAVRSTRDISRDPTRKWIVDLENGKMIGALDVQCHGERGGDPARAGRR